MSESARHMIDLLRSAQLTIATCESMTAGGIAARLADIPGASAVLRGGLITYASDLKISLAQVDADHIRKYGVINDYTARQMAKGARRLCRSDIGLSVTGVAGPDRQDGADVGTVWTALAASTWSESQCFFLDGDRNEIRRSSIDVIVRWAIQILDSKKVR